MIESSHRFGLAASSPNLSESSLARWAAVLGFTTLTLGPFGFGLAMRAITAHPPNWIQTSLTTRRWTKPVALIESCIQGVGAPPRTPLTPLGLRPRRRSGGGPRAGTPSGVWGGAPTPDGPILATPLFGTYQFASRSSVGRHSQRLEVFDSCKCPLSTDS
ncbi:MAG: hypothetical protein GY696_08095 [Gammaproteobacteria bacterium]|nr:hypothetical protein [Gammaproteobacteria bacterium]